MESKGLIIKVNGTFKGAPWCDLTHMTDEVEDAFDTITRFVSYGLVLDDVTVLKAEKRQAWPVEMFDGRTLYELTLPLQWAWEELLTNPVPPHY